MLLLRHRTRKIVFRLFALLYLMAALWLILFANGYRVQFSPFQITATGSVHATYVPKDAALVIDGAARHTSSPVRAGKLFPGLHVIQITADGYLPYERTVRVSPHETTFLTDIFLIRDATPIVIATSTAPHSFKKIPAADSDLTIETHPELGTRLMHRGSAISRDLGAPSWRIAASDDAWIALARPDTNSVQLRRRASPDVIATTLPGSRVLTMRYKDDVSFIIISTFELWQVSASTGAASLLYRVSKPITDVHVVPETPLIVVAHDDGLVALRTNDYQTIPTALARAVGVQHVSLGSDSPSVRYTARTDGLWVTYERLLY